MGSGKAPIPKFQLQGGENFAYLHTKSIVLRQSLTETSTNHHAPPLFFPVDMERGQLANGMFAIGHLGLPGTWLERGKV